MRLDKLLALLLRHIPYSWRGKIKDIPLLAPLQRVLVSRFLDGKEFIHQVSAGPAKGIVFHISMPDDKGVFTGTYEQKFAERMAATVPQDGVVYDIGAWHGFFSGVFIANGAKQVHVFEPLPDNAARIEKMITLNPGKKIILHPIAIADRDTDMELLIMPASSMAKLEASPFQNTLVPNNRLRVQVRSIDSLIASGEIEPPTMMKIDVEGAELHVLQGATETLKSFRPLIFAEIHSSNLLEHCTKYLNDHSYKVNKIDENSQAALTKDIFQIHAVPL